MEKNNDSIELQLNSKRARVKIGEPRQILYFQPRSFFFRKCFHENERERARQGAARKEEHERESGLKKLVQIK
jgi:hypothetical protein